MSRLKLLIRKNQGKKELKNYIEKLSDILKISISVQDFSSLEKSDELSAQYYLDFKKKEKKIDKIVKVQDLMIVPEMIKKELSTIESLNDKTYLISKQSEICGVVVVPLESCLKKENIKSLIELDGDNLCLITIDKKVGIYIDYYSEYKIGIETFYYQVTLW